MILDKRHLKAAPLILFALSASAQPSGIEKAVSGLENYLNMAGAQTVKDFRPLTQKERTDLYLWSLVNPWGLAKAAMSAGLDQAHKKPEEWGHGWDAYGQRYANIEGQYLVQKTVSFLMSSSFHEDTRYFGSGQHRFWPRLKYSIASSVLARHDNGKQYISAAQLGGVAAGAFVARLWLPPSQSSAGDAAVSFGITIGANAATSVVKEFLPDILHRNSKKNGPVSQPPPVTGKPGA